MPDEQFKTCPDCAEQIKLDAAKCRYCGYRYDQPEAGSSGDSATDARADSFEWQPSAPPTAVPSAPSGRSIKWPLLVTACVCAFGVAIAVAALGSSGASATQAAYKTCKSQAQATLSSLTAMNSRLDVGMTLDAYTTQVGNVKVVMDQLAAQPVGQGCERVVSQLTHAVDQYTTAVADWNSYAQDGLSPSEQPYWTTASQDLLAATDDLAVIGGEKAGHESASYFTGSAATLYACLASTGYTLATDTQDEAQGGSALTGQPGVQDHFDIVGSGTNLATVAILATDQDASAAASAALGAHNVASSRGLVAWINWVNQPGVDARISTCAAKAGA